MNSSLKEKMASDLPLETMRRISISDTDSLRELYVFSLSKNVDGFIQDLNFHGDIAQRSFEYQENGGEMLGVFKNDVLIGFGGIRKKPKADDSLKIVELCNLHLHPDYQGMGIGKKIAVALIQIAQERGYKTVELHVTATQQAALGLYKRLGFIETRRQAYELLDKVYNTVFMELPLIEK